MAGAVYHSDCVFAKIVRGEIPSVKLLETPHALAVLDAFPITKGHALLLPKALGYVTLADMPPAAAAAVLQELPRLVRAVMDATGADGVNVVQNNGVAAGQEVMHVHFHLIPRFARDGLVRIAPSAKAMLPPADAEEIASAIREQLARGGSAAVLPGTLLGRLLGAHALVLSAHEWLHRRVDATVVFVVRLFFGRLFG
jgi:diadenosine tetraphosphate (Ap4A) HIT family hydrolase